MSSGTYVYDSNSVLYEYIENYKNYLISQRADIEDARLISFDELENLGCSSSKISCTSAPSWVYSTSYWTGSSNTGLYVWFVRSNGSFDDYNYSGSHEFGVRPVIVLKFEF